MLHLCTAVTFVFLASTTAPAQAEVFSRFTEELTQTLESDAATVMTIGLTYEVAGKLCTRLGNSIGMAAQNEVNEWRKRNDLFFRAAASAITDFAERSALNGGESAKQGYLQMIAQAMAKEADWRVIRQFRGANLDNDIIPQEKTCSGLSNLLHDRVTDIEKTPEVTRALTIYMQKKGLL